MKYLYILFLVLFINYGSAQNADPLKTKIVTADLANFWEAFDKAGADFRPEVFQKLYIDRGTKGVEGFMKGRIRDSEHLSKVIALHANYYRSIKPSTQKIAGMEAEIRNSLVRLKALYPEAIFPPVYFVVGALNSGGTSSDDGLIIGTEMYGLTPDTPKGELNDWLKTVVKGVEEIPHIVAHELIHFQQTYDGKTLLEGSLKEGSADFIAELISGKHINGHVHDFANPKEKELWLEFKDVMLGDKFDGWLYSSREGRPNDLGYWMGYKITKSYYDNMADKNKAIRDILNIRDAEKFLVQSRYGERFK